MSEKEILLKQLSKLISPMDVPSFRRENPFWLSRNLGFRNSQHKNYEKAMEVIAQLLRMGVR